MKIKMRRRITKATKKIQAEGFLTFVRGVRESPKKKTENARRKVRDYLLELHQGRIAYGPFKGMEIQVEQVSWGDGDLSAKILGVYEKCVLDKIAELGETIEGPFIDIGAADGYYVIGAVKAGLFREAHAFEIDPRGREAILCNADVNGVSDKIFSHAEADLAQLQSLITSHSNALVLIDIEGAEFDLLDVEMFEALRKCTIIVESHPRSIEEGNVYEQKMLERAAKHFTIEKLKGNFVSPNEFDELDGFSDFERLMAFSEGRAWAGYWFLMTPRRMISS